MKLLLTDTGRWPTLARLAVAFAKAGARVSILCPSHHPALKTHAVAESFHFSSLRPLDSLKNAIEGSSPAIVIPCDDRSVQLLHELHARAVTEGNSEIAGVIARSLGDTGSFGIVSSRYELMKIAREEGVRAPETYPIAVPDDIKRLKGTQRLPWVMKVDGTSGGRGVKFAQTPEEAERFFSEAGGLYRTTRIFKRLVINRDPFLLRPWWRGLKPAVTAQAYIQGRPANCAVACWEGRVLAGFGVDVISADGTTGPASVVRVVNNPEMMLAAERIAKRLGLSGLFGLDFMIEEGTGDAYLIEMNPRCTPLCHLQLGKARDMVGALLAHASNQPVRDLPPVTQNELIAYFPQAWISNSEFLQSSFQDIPWEEPELTQELLRPWPHRTPVYTVYQFLWTRLFQPNSATEQ
jgi:carbamoylphosphate synthase large subunit